MLMPYRIALIFLLLANISVYGQKNNAPGRWLPGGVWQARNTKAVLPESEEPPSNPFDISTVWGTDIRLSYTSVERIHDPEIAAWGSYVYVAWWNVHDNLVDLCRSTDLGQTWEPQIRITGDTVTMAGIPQLATWDSYVYVVYAGGGWGQGAYCSRTTDYGITWYSRPLFYSARNTAGNPTVVTRGNNVYCLFNIEVNYVPPNQDFNEYIMKSTDYGRTWSDTLFVSDSIYSGIPPDMVLTCLEREPDPYLHLIRQIGTSTSCQEVFYQRSSDGGVTWSPLVMISDNDTLDSQWPQISAWGDSNVIATWMDYKYSSGAWVGDALVSKSTDNGLSWSSPVPLTFSHMIKSCDIYASGDTVVLVYDEGPLEGYKNIYANISFDGGNIWQGQMLVSDSLPLSYRVESCVAMSGGYAHVAWGDARDLGGMSGNVEAYYDRGYIDSSTQGIDWHENSPRPEGISLGAYPNPFNDEVLINLSNHLKGGDIRLEIIDITGRVVRSFNLKGAVMGGEEKIAWDATDARGKKVSSGIYFARLTTSPSAPLDKNERTIKLLYLK
jgi:hypothetical protein